MKYLSRLKSEIRVPNELPKLPKAPYDSFDSTEGRHFSENVSPEPQPYIEADGGLIIPFGSDRGYWWWAGGQSVAETIEELEAI